MQRKRSEALSEKPLAPQPAALSVRVPERSLYRSDRRLITALSVTMGVAIVLVLATGAALAYFLPRPSAEERLLRRFSALKNADDARAAELLGPVPTAPEGRVSREEAQRLDAEFLLRRPFRIHAVRSLKRTDGQTEPVRFKLVVKGGLASEPLLVAGEDRPSQRVLYNPDIIVEVRDGKLHGIRAQLHED